MRRVEWGHPSMATRHPRRRIRNRPAIPSRTPGEIHQRPIRSHQRLYRPTREVLLDRNELNHHGLRPHSQDPLGAKDTAYHLALSRILRKLFQLLQLKVEAVATQAGLAQTTGMGGWTDRAMSDHPLVTSRPAIVPVAEPHPQVQHHEAIAMSGHSNVLRNDQHMTAVALATTPTRTHTLDAMVRRRRPVLRLILAIDHSQLDARQKVAHTLIGSIKFRLWLWPRKANSPMQYRRSRSLRRTSTMSTQHEWH